MKPYRAYLYITCRKTLHLPVGCFYTSWVGKIKDENLLYCEGQKVSELTDYPELKNILDFCNIEKLPNNETLKAINGIPTIGEYENHQHNIK